MQTTALVHDSYVKLASGPDIAVGDRLQFFAYSSRVWRQLLFPVATTKTAAHYYAAVSAAARVFDFAPAALAR